MTGGYAHRGDEQKSGAWAREIAGMTLPELVALRDRVVIEIAARVRAAEGRA
jgi:hypothetical protein